MVWQYTHGVQDTQKSIIQSKEKKSYKSEGKPISSQLIAITLQFFFFFKEILNYKRVKI